MTQEMVKVVLRVPLESLRALRSMINEQDVVADSLEETVKSLFYVEGTCGAVEDQIKSVIIESLEIYEPVNKVWCNKCDKVTGYRVPFGFNLYPKDMPNVCQCKEIDVTDVEPKRD